MRARGERIGAQRAQCRALIEWARLAGQVRAFSYIEQFARVAEGAEHVVYHDPERGLAVKTTHANRFGHSTFAEGATATPLEYFQRLAWHNSLFGDDIRIEGVAHDESQIEVITTQPWINTDLARSNPLQSEIDAQFFGMGFQKVELVPDVPLYFHSTLGLLVADAHDRNVLRNDQGGLTLIDVVVGEPGPDLLRRIQEKLITT